MDSGGDCSKFDRIISQLRETFSQLLFGIKEIPTDNHIRSLLDAVPAKQLYSIFDTLIEQANKEVLLDRFRSIANKLLLTLNGTEYYRSSKKLCPHCHHIHHQNGEVSYTHQLITPAFVKLFPFICRVST